MIKKTIIMFFYNLNLAPICKHLSNKNVDKIRFLLTKLS